MDEIIINDDLIESINTLAQDLDKVIRLLFDSISDFCEKIREILSEIEKAPNKPKYAFIKSNIKPYKEPYIKVRYRARANL